MNHLNLLVLILISPLFLFNLLWFTVLLAITLTITSHLFLKYSLLFPLSYYHIILDIDSQYIVRNLHLYCSTIFLLIFFRYQAFLQFPSHLFTELLMLVVILLYHITIWSNHFNHLSHFLILHVIVIFYVYLIDFMFFVYLFFYYFPLKHLNLLYAFFLI